MKVVITDYEYDSIDNERQIITQAGFTLESYHYRTPERLAPVLRDADAVIVQYASITRELIAQLRHCKIIVRYGIGVDNIDCAAAAERRIHVCNIPDYGVEEVSDHAVALLLALSKKLPVITRALRNGTWGYQSIVPLQRFCRSTVGLVGFGRIPQLTARKLSGFQVNMMAYDPYAPQSAFDALGVKRVDFDTLCRQSDYISVHCPQTAETTGLFCRKVFGIMKEGAFLINTARGGIVCQQDLIEALQSGKLAGVALDVYEAEPLDPKDPLLSMENVIATPHCAWYSEDSIHSLQCKAAEEVVRVLRGEPPLHCVNLA